MIKTMETASSTPTSNGNSNPSSGSINSSLEDIQYLLYLETLIRFRKDDANIRRQIEEKMRQYQKAKNEYLLWYSKYVNLIKLCTTRNALEQDQPSYDDQIELAKRNIATIVEKTKQGNITDYITPEELDLLKQKLASAKNHENLEHLQKEAAENKAAVGAIHTTTDRVEATVETSIAEGFDYFLSELQLENFPNL